MGNRDTLPIGTVVNLSEYYESITRRQFLGTIGGFAAGSIGLSTILTRVAGASPEGEPLVQTVGSRGEPRRVKVVSQRRHSVLKRYETMPMEQLVRRYPDLRAVSVVSSDRDRSGLAFEMIFDGNEVTADEAADRTPSKLFGVPTVTTVEEANQVPESLQGGSDISVGNQVGTSTGVYYNSDGDPVVLTADHVGSGQSTISHGSQTVGDLDQVDDETDTASYVLRDDVDNDPLGMKNPLSDVDEAWTFSGISEEVSSGSLSVELYGRNSGHVEDDAVDTRRNRWYRPDVNWDYEVHMDTHSTAGGDSGAPWVHDDALVAQHVGAYEPPVLSDYSVGTAATETLNAVDVSLEDS